MLSLQVVLSLFVAGLIVTTTECAHNPFNFNSKYDLQKSLRKFSSQLSFFKLNSLIAEDVAKDLKVIIDNNIIIASVNPKIKLAD